MLNLSILDGWWDEAWQRPGADAAPIGWAIGHGESYDNPDYQDQVEADGALRPAGARRGPDVLRARRRRPAAPLDRAHEVLHRGLCPTFNMQRMVNEYTTDFYLVAHDRYQQLMADNGARARALAAWSARIRDDWQRSARGRRGCAGQQGAYGRQPHGLPRARAAGLHPSRARWPWSCISAGWTPARRSAIPTPSPWRRKGRPRTVRYIFAASEVPCRDSGLHGYTVRVLPFHPDAAQTFLPGLIRWADGVAGSATA